MTSCFCAELIDDLSLDEVSFGPESEKEKMEQLAIKFIVFSVMAGFLQPEAGLQYGSSQSSACAAQAQIQIDLTHY
jgi:hypothetical protein